MTTHQDQKISIIGAGGLGTPAAWGISSSNRAPCPLSIDIIDHDQVERSNLNRQILFGENDIGKKKAEVLIQKLQGLTSSNTTLRPINSRLKKDNIQELLGQSSLVIDGTDSVETKFILNDYCVRNGIPFCYGGVAGTAGQLLLTDPKLHNGCLRCLFGNFTQDDFNSQTATCQQQGIVGSVAGSVGFMMAEKCLDFLNGELSLSEGALLMRFSLATHSFTETRVAPDSSCPLSCKTNVKRQVLDLTAENCPMTFLYTKLALEKTEGVSDLEVRFSSLDSATNVERSVVEEGYQLVQPLTTITSDLWSVVFSSEKKS